MERPRKSHDSQEMNKQPNPTKFLMMMMEAVAVVTKCMLPEMANASFMK
jgi:hypothetical protein